ncbi:DUF1294-domain-containing protein [Delitschia confertaspora ATCC 74209]|uniref:DUF1294-domain-containing protein n=1 Tax=Delitschia confertaspora ATCC 74209 TaxID=1513339 RepID=A0A9P4JR55_9PLEO|nr:DUF1294-domain-containing protein [Delitschia confertaspora ATCC 74209]
MELGRLKADGREKYRERSLLKQIDNSEFARWALRYNYVDAIISTMPTKPRRRPITTATIIGLATLGLPIGSSLHLLLRHGNIWPLFYTCTISAATFLLYGYDKMQAKNLEWRVKESTLHIMELAGGWPGAMIGQHYFQHKTKKMRFQAWFWVIVGGWQVVWWAVWKGGVEEVG